MSKASIGVGKSSSEKGLVNINVSQRGEEPKDEEYTRKSQISVILNNQAEPERKTQSRDRKIRGIVKK